MKLFIAVYFVFVSISFSQTSTYIKVTGTSNIEYPADQINWTVDIRRIADTFEESTDQVNSVLKELLEIINQIGIDKDDIKVSPLQQGRYYENEYDRKSRIFKGFVSSFTVNFILKDLLKYSDLVSRLSKSDNFESIRSSYSDSQYEIHHKETLIKATDEAKKKAIYLSNNLGKKIGSVLEIDETSNSNHYYPNPFNSSTSLQYETPIVSGKVSYTRSVTIKFELID